VRVAGVVFMRGDTVIHCAPLDVVIEVPTAAKAMGAPSLVMVRLCCVTFEDPSATILNVIDGADATRFCAFKEVAPASDSKKTIQPARV
jgi:hypothetical protein